MYIEVLKGKDNFTLGLFNEDREYVASFLTTGKSTDEVISEFEKQSGLIINTEDINSYYNRYILKHR